MRRSKLLFIAAVGGVLFLGACGNGNANKALLYNNATNVDSEGFDFFKTVHEKAAFELELAKHAASVSSSSEVKALTAKITEVYGAMIPELENMAVEAKVVLPDPGTPAFQLPEKLATDSLGGFDDHAYLDHFVHAQKAILNQFKRVDRNTLILLNDYAAEKLPVVEELYAMAGGEEDHGAHH